MPIEKVEDEYKTNAVVKHRDILQTNNVIVGGKIKVKHPLLDETLLLIGFVVDDKNLNFEEFKVNGMSIKYKTGGAFLNSKNEIIYTKLIVDLKEHHFSYYYNSDEAFKYRDKDILNYKKYVWNDNSIHYLYDVKYSRSNFEEKFEYYLYEKPNSEIPECVSNEVYAVCKYVKDDTFKYALFSFHELMPE